MTSKLKMREPVFSEFPPAEYQRRMAKALALMAQAGLDAMLLTTEENIRYFAGGPLTELFQDKFNDFFLLLPADSSIDATLMMSTAREGPCMTSWVPDQRFWGYDKSASMMEQNLGTRFVADTIREKGLGGAVLGMELDDGLRLGMTFSGFEELRAMLPEARFESAAGVVWPIRAIKSTGEIAKIRKACGITCHAFEKGMSMLRPGIREAEVAAAMRSLMFAEGATGGGFLALYGGRQRGMWADARPSDYAFRKGDLVMFDGGCQVDGYYADVSRMASLGEPDAEHKHLYELAQQGNAAALERVRSGAIIKDIFAAGQKPFVDNGLRPNMVGRGLGQLGHGIGLSLHELPDMRADSEEALVPGMVFAVEPAVQDKPDWLASGYFLIVEDNVAVTEDGCEVLTPLPRELRIV